MQHIIKKLILGIGIACIGMFVAHRTLFFKSGPLERIAAHITYPFLATTGKIASTIQGWCKRKLDYATLQERHQKLLAEYNTILDEVITLRSTGHLYEHIKELCNFKKHHNELQTILAKVLVKHIADNEHYYLINQGLRDGVAKDMVAIYKQHLVGRVTDVYDTYSKVKLITDQHCKIAVYTSKTHATGIVQGINNLNRCSVTYVSHLFTVQDNDLVISSGQGLIFPEGFCAGKIAIHTLNDKELYHQIEIEPLIDLGSLSHCLLVDGKSIKQF